MDTIKEAATAFAESYGKAMELSLTLDHTNADAARQTCAEALAKHYAPSTVAYIYGSIAKASEDGDWTPSIKGHLALFDKSGLGWRVRSVKTDIHVYSAGSAQCWMTWESVPANGMPGWQWTNIYSFRRTQSEPGAEWEKGYWEYIVSDHEVGELLKRAPDFFSA